jgi:hypothetical protein
MHKLAQHSILRYNSQVKAAVTGSKEMSDSTATRAKKPGGIATDAAFQRAVPDQRAIGQCGAQDCMSTRGTDEELAYTFK